MSKYSSVPRHGCQPEARGVSCACPEGQSEGQGTESGGGTQGQEPRPPPCVSSAWPATGPLHGQPSLDAVSFPWLPRDWLLLVFQASVQEAVLDRPVWSHSHVSITIILFYFLRHTGHCLKLPPASVCSVA